VGDVFSDEGNVVHQGSGSNQDVCIADDSPLPTKISVDIGCFDNNFIGERPHLTVPTTLLEGSKLSSGPFGFEPAEDLVGRGAGPDGA